MKLLIVIAVAIAASSAAVLKEPQEKYKEGDRYFYFPGDDGELHLVDAEEPVDEEFIANIQRNPNDNAYWLFTRNNPTNHQVLQMGNANISGSYINFNRNTVILSHGWNGHGGNTMSRQLTENFLNDDNVNVIVLDWNRLANRGYTTARNGVPAVGRGLGQFINWLVSRGLNLNRVHLVGFSLGGHLVGNAGRELGGRVARITALDPAGPLWSRNNGRILKTDGRYVEVIHTNIGMFGYNDPCGDADFYPNGGDNQPGCILNTCSHRRAYEFMAATVRYNHLRANECASFRDALRNNCVGSVIPMGNSDLNKSWPRRGIFRANTGRNWPF